MATLSLVIIKNRPKSDGTFTIYVKVQHKRRASYLRTSYSVDSLSQWDGDRVVNRSDAKLINRKLQLLLSKYEDVVDELPYLNMTADEIKEHIKFKTIGAEGISAYADYYLNKIKQTRSGSYHTNMRYTLLYIKECFGENVTFGMFNLSSVERFENFLKRRGDSDTTINIRMTHFKAFLNSAVADGVAKFDVFPFVRYRSPKKNVRDICISKDEIERLRLAEFSGASKRRFETARDLFMLSFYCAGINLTDIMSAKFDKSQLTFIRKKTEHSKAGEKKVSITLQPEALEVAERYMRKDGLLDFGYKFSDYSQFRSFITKTLNRLGDKLGFEKKLMFYSARKTFCQFGFELGVPLFILEYAIGQTIKDAANRPVFDYIKIMRSQADAAIRAIIDYSLRK